MIEKKENEVCECDNCIVEQKRSKSITFWVGMALCVAQGLCGVLVATGILSELVSGTITAMFAGILAYCNGNNPCIKNQY